MVLDRKTVPLICALRIGKCNNLSNELVFTLLLCPITKGKHILRASIEVVDKDFNQVKKIPCGYETTEKEKLRDSGARKQFKEISELIFHSFCAHTAVFQNKLEATLSEWSPTKYLELVFTINSSQTTGRDQTGVHCLRTCLLVKEKGGSRVLMEIPCNDDSVDGIRQQETINSLCEEFKIPPGRVAK